MAQTTILAAGTSAATSTDILVAAGASVTVGLFSAAAIPPEVRLQILIDTPSADDVVGVLTGAEPVMVLSGPGTYRVSRPLIGVSVGVFTET